jgi:hypothetical protein
MRQKTAMWVVVCLILPDPRALGDQRGHAAVGCCEWVSEDP